jgi:hypothetical protein
LAKAASNVYDAYKRSRDRVEGIAQAAEKVDEEVVSTTISETIQKGSEEQRRDLSVAIGDAIASGVGNTFGVDSTAIGTIATETARRGIEGGIDGIISWGVTEMAE